MAENHRNINEAEREILRSLERAYITLRERGQCERAYVVGQSELSVRKIREQLGMSQNQFAVAFGISIKTIRNWEQGVSKPEGASRAYLTVIMHDSNAVLVALKKNLPQVIEIKASVS